MQLSWDNQIGCQFPVGLDGRYRTAVSNGIGPMAFKGAWDSENRFSLSWRDFKKPAPVDAYFIFDGRPT
jgi:hypothetical protein